MKRLLTMAAISASVIQGCATAPAEQAAELAPERLGAHVEYATPAQQIAHATLVPVEEKAPLIEGHPLTSVVVTQCNLLVAVYMTMPNGNLLRFDRTAEVPAEQLLAIAYTATRSERVEVSCENTGVVGYEAHAPI